MIRGCPPVTTFRRVTPGGGPRPRTDRAGAPPPPRARLVPSARAGSSSRSRIRSPTIAQTCASARARRAAGAVPAARSAARCRSSAASSSGTPSPVAAVVTMTSGRFGSAGGARTSSARAAAPRAGRRHEHRPQLGRGPQRPGLVALVDDHEVRDLEQARLDRLDLVAHLGRLEHDGRVGRGRDLDLALAGPDRLDQDRGRTRTRRARPPRRVEVEASPPACPRDAIERMNTSAIAGVGLHPDPVAEQRAAGDRARRVDRDRPPTVRPASRTSAISAETSVDLPEPGGPVIPTRCARPAVG